MRIKLAAGVAICAALVLVAGAAAHPFDVSPDHGFGGPPRGGPGHGRGAWFTDVCDQAVFTQAAWAARSSSPTRRFAARVVVAARDRVGAGQAPQRIRPDVVQRVDVADDRDRRRVRRSQRRRATSACSAASTACRRARRRTAASGRSSQTGTTRSSAQQLRLGARDLARHRDGARDLPGLQDPARSKRVPRRCRALETAENEAVKLGATTISNSYGGGESSFETSHDTAYFNHPGVAITVSSGDSGWQERGRVPGRVAVRHRGRRDDAERSPGAPTRTRPRGRAAARAARGDDAKPSWQGDSGWSRVGCGEPVADVSARRRSERPARPCTTPSRTRGRAAGSRSAARASRRR